MPDLTTIGPITTERAVQIGDMQILVLFTSNEQASMRSSPMVSGWRGSSGA